MPLLEKAYTKLDVNYDRISGGQGAEGLRRLTGQPTYYFQHKGQDMQAIHTYFASKNYPMTSGCCAGGTDTADGMTNGHAFTLLDVVKLDGGPVLAKMRNPWGRGEKYKGDFSDDSSLWTDAWKKQVNFKKADDGVWFTPYSNYLANFDTSSVALTDTWA